MSDLAPHSRGLNTSERDEWEYKSVRVDAIATQKFGLLAQYGPMIMPKTVAQT
jgi:hypothetical protein